MVKKKVIIFITVMLLTIFVISLFNNITYAANVLENLNDYKPDPVGEETELTEKAGVIIGAINIIGSVVSVITLMIIGFKYMTGSSEEKANYKKTIIPWIIGALLVFSITTIPNILYNVGKSLSDPPHKSSGGGSGSGTVDRTPTGPGVFFEEIY